MMKIGHLGLVCLLLSGCAHAPRRPPVEPVEKLEKQPDVDEKQRLLDLYTRHQVAEVPPTTTTPTRNAPPAADLSSLLHRDRASLRACYLTAHGRRGAPLEPLRLEIELETSERRVRSVQITGIRDRRLERCLSRRIRRWRLPALAPRTVSLPLVFSGS
jgi:hypothetical protein